MFCCMSICLPNISACLARAALTTVSMSDLFQCRILHFQVEKIIAPAVVPMLAFYCCEYGNCLLIGNGGRSNKGSPKKVPTLFQTCSCYHGLVICPKICCPSQQESGKRVFCPIVKNI